VPHAITSPARGSGQAGVHFGPVSPASQFKSSPLDFGGLFCFIHFRSLPQENRARVTTANGSGGGGGAFLSPSQSRRSPSRRHLWRRRRRRRVCFTSSPSLGAAADGRWRSERRPPLSRRPSNKRPPDEPCGGSEPPKEQRSDRARIKDRAFVRRSVGALFRATAPARRRTENLR
jgi:hypothetical protein